MGLLDDAKAKVEGLLHDHSDKVTDAVDKVGDTVDEKTGGKYADKVDTAQDFAKEQVDKLDGE